jgi:hypothetical protein
MRLHIDVLGWLHSVWGAFGLLTGLSLGILAVGLEAALLEQGSAGPSDQVVVYMFAICGGGLLVGGLLMLWVGGLLRRRRAAGRLLAIVFAMPNLLVPPFGTALGVYAFWVLLNDDARREFGRPLRAPAPRPPKEDR